MVKKRKKSNGFESSLKKLKSLKKKEKTEDIKFLKQRLSTTEPKKIRELEYKRELGKKKIKSEKTSARIGAVSGYVERTSGRIGSAIQKALKQKILKKPKVSLKELSSKKLIKSFAGSGYAMFKSEPKDYLEQPVQDKSNLFFR